MRKCYVLATMMIGCTCAASSATLVKYGSRNIATEQNRAELTLPVTESQLQAMPEAVRQNMSRLNITPMAGLKERDGAHLRAGTSQRQCTFHVKYDPGKVFPMTAQIGLYPRNGSGVTYVPIPSDCMSQNDYEFTADVPDGVYDAIVMFCDQTLTMYLPVAANVDFSTTDRVELDVNGCTAHMWVSPTLSNGVAAQLPVYDNVGYTDEGNVGLAWAVIQFTPPSGVGFIMRNTMYYTEPGKNRFESAGIYTTPGDNGMWLNVNIFMPRHDNVLDVVGHGAGNMVDGALTNTAADYLTAEVDYHHNPSYASLPEGFGAFECRVSDFSDGYYGSDSRQTISADPFEPLDGYNYAFLGYDAAKEITTPIPACVDGYDENMASPFFFTFDTPVYRKDNKAFHSVNQAFTEFERVGGSYRPTIGGHPAFSYFDGESEIKPNASSPLTVINWDLWKQDNSIANSISPFFRGRLGEIRNADRLGLQCAITYNDKELIPTKNFDYYDMHYLWTMEGESNVKYTLHMENANIEIDGIQGVNITDIVANGMASDRCNPIMMFLQTRNSDGKITDRFNEIGEMSLAFAATDVDVDADMNPVFKSCNVKLECAANGTDTWVEVPADIDPELYDVTFGDYYNADFSDFSLGSVNRWYDLRFSLTDECGNSMVQTVPLAFRIETQSGINSVYTDKSDKELRIFDAAGCRHNELQQGLNIVFDSEGNVSKVIR